MPPPAGLGAVASRRLAEKRLSGLAIFVSHFLVELDSEAGLLSDLDVAVLDQRALAAFDQVIEERHRGSVPFERKEIRDGGAEVDGGHGPDRPGNVVGGTAT